MTHTEDTWLSVFRKFYNTNERGGSSRWLVAPNIVELFICSQKAVWDLEAKREERRFIKGKIDEIIEMAKKNNRASMFIDTLDLQDFIAKALQ